MNETLKLSPMSETLAKTIPYGWENAIRRDALAAKVGTSDRLVRKAIEEARAEGLIILNRQDGRGYYQSADPEELLRQYRQDTARAMAILARRKPLRDILKQIGVDLNGT